MCGICGFIDFRSGSDVGILNNMVSTLHHRGPDDRGSEIFSSESALVGFGQTRLSIIDTSPAGHQPMHFEHLSIVLNGEIYNYHEIKQELKVLGHKFVSESDTEVVLHAFMQWGKACIPKFIGMFAFVILDKKNLAITFVRDRAGVKPLYYYMHNDLFIFGSELKPFCIHPGFKKELDMNAVGYYFKMGYVPSPYSIYKNTSKLDSGHIAVLNLRTKELKIEKYWDVNDFYKMDPITQSYDDSKSQLKELLESAINYRMVADVPVGVFLSGGYDSTAVTAILQKDRTDKIKTFTIGFEEGNNEAPFARETARYLGTDHTEYICTTKEAQSTIPSLPFFFDEPFADSSAIPTMLVSKVARSKVTVALSADAGDELFCGYNSHIDFLNTVRRINNLKTIESKFTSNAIKAILKIIPSELSVSGKLSFLNSILASEPKFRASFIREGMLSAYPDLFAFVLNNMSFPSSLFETNSEGFQDQISIALAIDYKCYLQNDILTKVDRATMSVSLEGREPLVDNRLIEYAARLPIQYKYDGLTSKKILKDLVHEIIPERMMNRPKTGFTLPIYSWLRKDLAYLLEDHLSVANLAKTGIYNIKNIERLIYQFKNNSLHDESIIWKILQFQMWYTMWMA